MFYETINIFLFSAVVRPQVREHGSEGGSALLLLLAKPFRTKQFKPLRVVRQRTGAYTT